MSPSHELQPVFAKALCAEAHAVDADRPPGRELFDADVIRIRFQRDLRISGHIEVLSYQIQEAFDPFDRDQARRSSAEIDGGGLPIGELRGPLIQLALHCIENPIHSCGVGAEVEIAIGAGSAAEGDMEVDAWQCDREYSK